MVSGNLKIMLDSAQYGEETRTARLKRKMEGKNIYLSVFPEFSELLSFSLLKFNHNYRFAGNQRTILLRITSLSLSTG